MGRLSENSVVNIKNKSHSVTAEVVVPPTGAEGVVIAQGGNGGWSLQGKGGKLKYCYNLLGIQYFFAESDSALSPVDHQVRMEISYLGGGLGKGGTAFLFVDVKKVGEGKVAVTAAMIFSADDGCDVGVDTGHLSRLITDRTGMSFRAISKAFNSLSPMPLKAPITSLSRRKPSGSPWLGSN